MSYRKFDTGAWQDPWFEELSPKAKLLFIYLFTNDVCNQAGLYEISKRRMSFEIGFDVEEVMPELSPKVMWDGERQVVWVKSFFKWQCQNESFVKGALKGIASSPYFEEYTMYNGDILSKYPDLCEEYHINTVLTPNQDSADMLPTPCQDSADMVPASEQNRTEQNRTDKLPDGNSSAEPPPTPKCPQTEIRELYNSCLPELPQCKHVNKTMEKNLRARWREDTARQSLDWWKGLFDQIRGSDFLMGRSGGTFTCTFDWIIKPTNLTKILNGNYENRSNGRMPNGTVTGSVRMDANLAACQEFVNGD